MGVIEIEELQVWGQRPGSSGKTLLSTGATARQSSQFGGYAAGNALDHNEGTFSHTNEEVHPWFEVDFKVGCVIERVEIRVRRWFNWRMRGARISVLDDQRGGDIDGPQYNSVLRPQHGNLP
ncbi:MAG: hypothetical protein D6820_03880 [Lentisphaerae bacterium]|nr:MAG: hypothetical protein D6820_03880 [Lentisphaerota bacterium]